MLVAAPPALAQTAEDPFEKFNRAVFSFNQVVDGLLLAPAANLYGRIVPRPAKTGLQNFLQNLTAPVVFINQVMQGDRDRAGVTLSRFMVNTLLGGLGVYDMAENFGFEPYRSDFGLTLGTYGVPPGPYLVLPIVGPSTFRDATGLAVDSLVLDPISYIADTNELIARYAATTVDTRYQLTPVLDDLERNSIDLYSTLRSVYLQRRTAALDELRPLDPDEVPDARDLPFEPGFYELDDEG